MRENVRLIIKKYLEKFSKEKERLFLLEDYLNKSDDNEIIDWNNINGHLTVGAFVYCVSEDKFLVLYHKDLKMYLYPGGHVDKEDKSLLDAAKRELEEETGLKKLKLLQTDNMKVPFDIDIHLIPINERVNIPEHYHFDFRYLFLTETISEINFDKQEFNNYKWISSEELSKDKNYGKIISKVKSFIDRK